MKNNAVRLLRVEDVADQLCVCEATVWRRLREGVLPRIKIGRATRVPADAVAAFVADQRRKPPRRTRRRSG